MTRSGPPKRSMVCPSCLEPWSPQDAHTCGPCGAYVPAPVLSSSSGTPTTTNAKRTRPMVTLTLSHEALARLDAIAAERGQTRSGAVEQLVRNARLRETGSR